jgi:heat shock protein HslJ
MKTFAILVLLIASLLVTACVAPAPLVPAQPTQAIPTQPAQTPTDALAPEATAAGVEASAIPVEALKNATYSGIYDEPITLTDGLFEGEPFAEGDPARPTVAIIDGAELFGDLNGDGVDDAVIFLLERGGGSGAFTYVAAQLNQDGQPVDAGAVRIEDRIGVKSAAVVDGQIMLEIITQGPGDVACCGTHKAHKTYALQDGRLSETTPAGGELVQISAVDLDGTSWTLLALDGQPAPADTAATLSFQANQVSGSGGCNSYSASFSLGEDNPFVMTIGPFAATEKSCPEPAGSQESAYLAALGSVERWGYDFGRLALYYAGGQEVESRLLFAPQAAPGAITDQAIELVPPPTEDLLMLRAHPWQWISFTNPLEVVEIEDPASYRVSFNPDASLAVTADCNDVVGFYQGEWGEALTIAVDPAALADCGPGSRSAQFVTLLGAGARYFFEGENLFIDLFADGGTMGFAPSGEVTAPDPDDYMAASSISKDGFAINDEEMRQLDGQEVMLWGYVDHGNIYGDEGAKTILGDWWSGAGPDAATWRFNLKARAGDAAGKSFAVTIPNDAGRDELLRRFVADAQAQQPTRVFVTGWLTTFEAPSGDRVRTGLMLDVQSSSNIRPD